MVDVGYSALARIPGDGTCRGDAADPARVDLDEADAGTVDHVTRHENVVRSLATGEFDRRGLPRERAVRLQRAGEKWLLEPGSPEFLKGGQSCPRTLEVVFPNRAGIDQQHPVLTKPFPRRRDLM